MRNVHRYLALLALIGALLLGRAAADTGSFIETDLVANLASLTFKNGIVHQALHVDPNLKNAWGITSTPASPIWISDNNNGTSTLYRLQAPQFAPAIVPLVVSIPAPGDPLGTAGAPTGTVFNIAAAQGAFKISGVSAAGGSTAAPAFFLFATEDGTILGWNPGVNPSSFVPAKAGTYGIIAVDKSSTPSAANGAVYKGLAIATNPGNGKTLSSIRGGKKCATFTAIWRSWRSSALCFSAGRPLTPARALSKQISSPTWRP